jgi:hypothetical protein
MPKRLTSIATLLSVATFLLAFLPASQASAASPWWQVLAGSRPTNLWVPEDNVQEIDAEMGSAFGLEGVAAGIEAGGKVVGCLGTANALGTGLCQGVVGFPPDETSLQLQATLQTAFATDQVEVTGGPVAAAPFRVTTAGRGAPAIKLTPLVGTTSAKVVSQGGSGRLVLTITNLGDAAVDGTTKPVAIVDELPDGIIATGVEALAGLQDKSGPVDCAVETGSKVTCSFAGTLPPFEAIEIEVYASLTGTPPEVVAPGKVTVSGGNAPSASAGQTIEVSDEKTPFGVEDFSVQAEEEGGTPSSQAGKHPFQVTTTVQLNSGPVVGATRRDSVTVQPALPRNLHFSLPPGLVGNATAVSQCEMTDFTAVDELINKCPDESAIGVAAVTIVESNTLGLVRLAVPVFNLPPAYGEPARFGFMAAGAPIIVDTAVSSGNKYRIIASVRNATQVAQFLASTVSFWGTPGDPRHDSSRGWGCAYFSHPGGCQRPSNLKEDSFLRQPVSCGTPLDFHLELEPWNVPVGSAVERAESTSANMVGCNQVPFDPSIASSPTSKLAGSPSGLDFQLDMPNTGLLSSQGIAEGQAKKVEVTLPRGTTVNPSAGEGLVGCTPAEYARETASSLPGEGCPEASKVGDVQISTPLVVEEAHGSLYVATPHDNPSDSLVALYMVAKIPERGVIIKQVGKVEPDPVTGQIVTTFDDVPQVPFDTVKLHFREGGRAPLVTPPTCGAYDVVARFTPWAATDPGNPAPSEVVTRTSSFTVERGVDGGACPNAGVPPFHPGLLAGTINNAAGKYSPFNLRLTRKDGEQEFTHFSIKLPPGVSGKLAGIPFCPEAAIAAAKARTGANGGQEELEHPSCPVASQVGRTLVGAGVGASLTYVPGKLYLAGPYHGSALSIVSITAAKVGPFDLGTVVVREALKVNPETAEVFVDATGSDPIPHIIQGIVVHARDIRVYADRPEFVLNPTSCERTSTASTVLGSGLDFASAADDVPVTVSTPFQAADCASLGFKPRLSLGLKGGTKRGSHPALRAVLRPRAGDANSAAISVQLPHSEFLDQSHIRTVCTRVQFKAGAGNGAECPAGSIYGHATAYTPILDRPLRGPIFLRSSEHPLPDLVMALHGLIDIDAVGRIDSVEGGIRNTFDFVPDAPVSKVVVDFQGGKKGLLVNSTDICKRTHRAIVKFTGHNGKTYKAGPALKGRCPKAKKHKGARRGKPAARHRHAAA